ncbi:MAG: hypothetical protein FWG50_01200, partial [Kiritimatiellaeota bacterium]|nr:hypothetical protein [Kiritimatiellota bacterium]
MKCESMLKAIGVSGVALGLMMLAGCGDQQWDERYVFGFYVSPQGSDTNVGTKKAPFATLERARDEVRAARQTGDERLANVILL